MFNEISNLNILECALITIIGEILIPSAIHGSPMSGILALIPIPHRALLLLATNFFILFLFFKEYNKIDFFLGNDVHMYITYSRKQLYNIKIKKG